MTDSTKLTKADIERLMRRLDEELAEEKIRGELYTVGGAVMCLALDARPATRDVDAYFRPTREVRQAAVRVAGRVGVADNWLNDAVQEYLSSRGDFAPYLELPNLLVYVARPESLLAMKCAAMLVLEELLSE